MIELHPEYDGMWFVRLDGRIREAATLRELQVKLGVGYRLIGYYPNGYRVNQPVSEIAPIEPVSEVAPIDPAPVASNEPVLAAPSKRAPGRPRTRYDHEQILDLWAAGYTGPEIGQKLRMSNWRRVGEILTAARERGDPRAKRRSRNPNWNPNHPDHRIGALNADATEAA